MSGGKTARGRYVEIDGVSFVIPASVRSGDPSRCAAEALEALRVRGPGELASTYQTPAQWLLRIQTAVADHFKLAPLAVLKAWAALHGPKVLAQGVVKKTLAQLLGGTSLDLLVEPGATARAEDAASRAAAGELTVTLRLSPQIATFVRQLSTSGFYGQDLEGVCLRLLETGLRIVAADFARLVPGGKA